MLKKYTAIIFLCVAYLVMLGHSVVPHHHHDHHEAAGPHHHDDHHYADHGDHHDADHEDEGGSLGDTFSHLEHSSIVFVVASDCGACLQLQVLGMAIPAQTIHLSDPETLYSAERPPSEPPFHESPHSLSSGLRAPPIFIA